LSNEIWVWILLIFVIFEMIHIVLFYLIRNYLAEVMGGLTLIILICITLIFYIECRKDGSRS